MNLTHSELEVLKAIDKSCSGEGGSTSLECMLGVISDPVLRRDDMRIREALASLENKTFLERTDGQSFKLTEGGLVALRAL